MTDGRKAAVLGSPIAHSLSPVLHRTAYRELGLGVWTYECHNVDERGLKAFLDIMDNGWAGLGLTMPLKRAVLPLLDSVTDIAESVQSVNTVFLTATGRKAGINTDIPGITAALRERGVDHVERAAVLGGGATAASALAALARMGARKITAHVRSAARAEEMRQRGGRLGVDVRTVVRSRATHALGAPLVVSTAPAHATDALADAVPERPGVLFDVVYDLAHPARPPLAVPRRHVRGRPRSVSPPGGAAGGGDDGTLPGTAARHASRGRTRPRRPHRKGV